MKSLSMHKRVLIALGAFTLGIVAPALASTPVRAQIHDMAQAIVDVVRRPEVQLTLSAEKQILSVDVNGQEKLSWQAVSGVVKVQPGDVLRYTVDGSNSGDAEAKDLVITQPIPERTTYVLETAKSNAPATLTYSIDGGQTFVAEPMVDMVMPDGSVQQQPAPAEAYTHVRWSLGESLIEAATVKASYEVKVQ
jgi:uncharacterized repeat protein (TIGR01451 family)